MDPNDLQAVLSAVRDFVRKDVVPREEEIEDADEVPAELREACKGMGLYGYALPEEYGGLGLSMSEEVRLAMELGYTTPALRSMFGTNNGIAGQVVLRDGTEEQRRAWLPRLASGEVTASFALTEADAGSDPSDLRTRARRDGAEWVLDGTKRYITNAPLADVFMVFARTSDEPKATRGISVFLVPADAPGVTVGPRDRKMGQHGSQTADVVLDGVRVGDDLLVGGPEGEGRGFATAMKSLGHGRLHIAGLCAGIGERLVDETVAYARERTQGGSPIGAFQLVQGLIADSVTDYRAMRALVLDAAADYDAGRDAKTAASTAKYFASEAVGRIADRAVQVHGGAGYMHGVAVERLYRDVRLFRIYEGTSQVQQVIIAKQALAAR